MSDRLLVRCCCKPTKILGSLPLEVGKSILDIQTFSHYFHASDALMCEATRNPTAAAPCGDKKGSQ